MLIGIVWLVGIYLLIGLYMATLGSLGRDIRQKLDSHWRASSSHAERAEYFTGQAHVSPPRWKHLLFAVVLGLGVVLGWPVFLPGLRPASPKAGKLPQATRIERRNANSPLRETHQALEQVADNISPSLPPKAPTGEPRQLRFNQISGLGSLSCQACGHSEGLQSLIHGHRDDGGRIAGYQCRSCHQFQDVRSSKTQPPDLYCPCGGELTRDETIVCPQCQSTNLHYKMLLLT